MAFPGHLTVGMPAPLRLGCLSLTGRIACGILYP